MKSKSKDRIRPMIAVALFLATSAAAPARQVIVQRSTTLPTQTDHPWIIPASLLNSRYSKWPEEEKAVVSESWLEYFHQHVANLRDRGLDGVCVDRARRSIVNSYEGVPAGSVTIDQRARRASLAFRGTILSQVPAWNILSEQAVTIVTARVDEVYKTEGQTLMPGQVLRYMRAEGSFTHLGVTLCSRGLSFSNNHDQIGVPSAGTNESREVVILGENAPGNADFIQVALGDEFRLVGGQIHYPAAFDWYPRTPMSLTAFAQSFAIKR